MSTISYFTKSILKAFVATSIIGLSSVAMAQQTARPQTIAQKVSLLCASKKTLESRVACEALIIVDSSKDASGSGFIQTDVLSVLLSSISSKANNINLSNDAIEYFRLLAQEVGLVLTDAMAASNPDFTEEQYELANAELQQTIGTLKGKAGL